ncbi:MAG: hypothetical protein LBT26_02040 [Clostridiales Family XIII bacterium]|jgi:DNA polymerase-3 subunit delta'|nr:hypothetical protein [Clostridiales Family XIII bacterium]
MEFQGINLSARTLKRLHAWTEREAFSHAYIFAGPPEADKMGAARAFLKTAYCLAEDARPCGHCIMCTKIEHGNHEDLLYVQREGSSIGVKQIEDLQQRLRNKPYASERISAVIEDADKMTPQSQNKLLKTLEEPNPGNILI